MDANGISIHYELAGSGPSVVLLHEMGGTLASWDGIFPALSGRYRTLRYDQRGSGLTEKVRNITTEILVADLEAVLQQSGLPPPYHFVTVAAATMQALLYMTKYPDRIGKLHVLQPVHRRRSEPGGGAPGARRARRARRHARRDPDHARQFLAVEHRRSGGLRDLSRTLHGARSGLLRGAQPLDRAAERDASRQGHQRSRRWWSAGASTRCGPPAASEQFAKTVPGARYELIDAVHMMPAQAPGPLLALLQDFLGKHARY